MSGKIDDAGAQAICGSSENKRSHSLSAHAGGGSLCGLKKIAKDHGIERGVILSAIGSLKNVVFVNVRPHTGIPVKAEYMIEIEEAGPFELLSLGGDFFPSLEDGEPVVHLHAILGTSSGSVSGGHLLKATVFTTAGIILGSIAGSSVYKAKSDVTRRMELLKG